MQKPWTLAKIKRCTNFGGAVVSVLQAEAGLLERCRAQQSIEVTKAFVWRWFAGGGAGPQFSHKNGVNRIRSQFGHIYLLDAIVSAACLVLIFYEAAVCPSSAFLSFCPSVMMHFNNRLLLKIRTSDPFSSIAKSGMPLNQLYTLIEPTPVCAKRRLINTWVTAKPTLATARYCVSEFFPFCARWRALSIFGPLCLPFKKRSKFGRCDRALRMNFHYGCVKAVLWQC